MFALNYLFPVLLICISTIAVNAQDSAGDDKSAILAVRSRSNMAFKYHQTDSILFHLTDDINISASNGDNILGKSAFREDLTVLFNDYPDLYFIRSAEETDLNTQKTTAWEKGSWKALRPDTEGWKSYGGKYSAYWKKTDGIWKIKSELFVRLD